MGITQTAISIAIFPVILTIRLMVIYYNETGKKYYGFKDINRHRTVVVVAFMIMIVLGTTYLRDYWSVLVATFFSAHVLTVAWATLFRMLNGLKDKTPS